MTDAPRPPLPPFTAETAVQKVRMAEDALEQRDPATGLARLYGRQPWRNRAEFFEGRDEIVAFLTPQVGARARLPADQGALGLRPATASPCASPTSATTTPATGSAPMATRTGSSTTTA